MLVLILSLNAISLQEIDYHVSPRYFFFFFFHFLYGIANSFLGNRNIFPLFNLGLVFRDFRLWDCQQRIVISLCYLTHSWGWERRNVFIPFPRALVRKWKQQTNPKSEPGQPISLYVYISITQAAHFRSANMCVSLSVCRHVHAHDYKSMREYVCVFFHLILWISGCVCGGRGCRKLK